VSPGSAGEGAGAGSTEAGDGAGGVARFAFLRISSSTLAAKMRMPERLPSALSRKPPSCPASNIS
jgi:hypothetical protein